MTTLKEFKALLTSIPIEVQDCLSLMDDDQKLDYIEGDAVTMTATAGGKGRRGNRCNS